VAAKLIPSVKSGHAGCVWALARDLQNVPKAVAVKAAHGCQVASERLTVSLLQLLHQGFDVGGDYFFDGLALIGAKSAFHGHSPRVYASVGVGI
jgi:hypothetical protein